MAHTTTCRTCAGEGVIYTFDDYRPCPTCHPEAKASIFFKGTFMSANINPATGIAYGYISANALHPDVVQTLQDNGKDVDYDDAVAEAQNEAVREWASKLLAADVLDLDLFVKLKDSDLVALDDDRLSDALLEYVQANWSGSEWEQKFNDDYQPDEPIHEGEHEGVKYRTSWLGGALNVYIFESPFVTETARECSLCVPNAGNLDQVGQGSYQCYDVPASWRADE